MGRRVQCMMPHRVRTRERYWILRQLGYDIDVARKNCPNPWRFEQLLKEMGLEPADGWRLTRVSEKDSYTRVKNGAFGGG